MEIDIKGKRIGVLMGGPSSEREVSLKSGKAVFEALKGAGVDVVAVDIVTDSRSENIELLKRHSFDAVFLALHGRFGEDGGIQSILEEIGLSYTGSGAEASALAMDKIASRKIFQKHGLKVARNVVARKGEWGGLNLAVRALGLPLVIKPANNGSSIGLTIIYKEADLDNAMRLAFSFDEHALIEEYLPGREMTVGILGDAALPVIEIIPKHKYFDYEAKYGEGLTDYIVPAKIDAALSRKIQDAGLSSHRLLGCSGCSRVDIILKDATPFVLEVNTIPGFTSTSLLPKAAKVAGLEFAELCLKLLKFAHEKK